MSDIDPDLRTFLGGAFSAEVVDRLDHLRPGLNRMPAERLTALRRSFRALIDQRSMRLPDWARTTDTDFETEEELYNYLQECYAYLFEGAATFPEAPL
ncbi:hypothetical protein [Streptomyces sp. NPDC007088]|uniref:hypothetical protein n=1 Tax=Streptomyces sp. NPDC007088 TaxID=3364773 RepID=UPI0036BC8E4B